jgi:hypothetical protein
MSQFPPPPPPPGYAPAYNPPPGGQPQTSGAAIAALVLGLLSCIPGVGLLAVIFGFAGVGATKNPRYGGRGFAVTGIVLGILSLLIWGGIGYGAYWGYGKLKEMAAAFQFSEALSRGSVAEAKTFTTGKMSDAELTKLSETIKSLGKLKELKNPTLTNENDIVDIKGTGIFANGTKQVHFVMVKTPGGYKVEKLTLE